LTGPENILPFTPLTRVFSHPKDLPPALNSAAELSGHLHLLL
jgi:hypothetical protein